MAEREGNDEVHLGTLPRRAARAAEELRVSWGVHRGRYRMNARVWFCDAAATCRPTEGGITVPAEQMAAFKALVDAAAEHASAASTRKE